jgi:tRNA(fMet)-specific endonuclease VapC
MVIDTSLFIEFLRAKEKGNTRLYNLPDNVTYSLSTVTLFELYMGATSPEKEKSIQLLTNGLNILPFNDEIALRSGQIYQALKRKNQMIEFRDIFIAATSLVHSLPLATLNRKHFERIEGLVLI